MRILFVSLFVVVLDQVTKLIVKGISIPALGINLPGMPFRSSIEVIGNIFQITFIENPGMAFGLQIGGKLFLSLFTIFATLLILFFIYKNRKEGLYIRLSLALILGGAIGNLIDRVFYGKIFGYGELFYGNVVDFLHINTPDFSLFGRMFYSFPIFNVADISVTVGFLLILFGYNKIFKEQQDNELKENELLAAENGIEINNEDIAKSPLPPFNLTYTNSESTPGIKDTNNKDVKNEVKDGKIERKDTNDPEAPKEGNAKKDNPE